MNAEHLDLYTDYLISSFGPTTATGLAALLDGRLSHDQVTRLLSSVYSFLIFESGVPAIE